MLYISLSAVFIKKVNNFNKTWLNDIEYAESEFRIFEFVIIYCCLYEYKVNKIYRNSKIIIESCFQRFYWGNRVRWFRIWYRQQHMINICCCLRLKSKQILELYQKRGFNDSTGVIGYADSWVIDARIVIIVTEYSDIE